MGKKSSGGRREAVIYILTELTAEELEPFKEVVKDFKAQLIESYGEEACDAFGITAE